MNAQLKVVTDKVRDFEAATQRVKGRDKPVKGYALMSDTRVLAFIETTQPHERLEELLEQYASGETPLFARELMRDLLNVEDYRSTVYDVIVRVYYSEDFA
jgi:hypothetical protein